MEALEKQLAEEAELASATLDRAEAAERELTSLRTQLEEQQARPEDCTSLSHGVLGVLTGYDNVVKTSTTYLELDCSSDCDVFS